MDLRGKKVILGSNSPRRRELLAGLDVEFTVDTGTSFEERYSPDTPHTMVPRLMSEGKSRCFHRELGQDEILITADTMVLQGGLLLGKPHSREDAATMLRDLSGREHQVLTSVTIRDCNRHETFEDVTNVWFMELTDDEINYYIDKYKPFDKAGSYGVQEWIGYIGIERIEGSFYNVMGFPVHRVYRELQKFL